MPFGYSKRELCYMMCIGKAGFILENKEIKLSLRIVVFLQFILEKERLESIAERILPLQFREL